MRVRLFVFFSVFTFMSYGQSIEVGYAHGDVTNLAISYVQKLNSVIYGSAGIGCMQKDSLFTTYDVNGTAQQASKAKYYPSIAVTIGAKTNTKPLYCYANINTIAAQVKKTAFLGMGLGYKVGKYYFSINTNVTQNNVGYGAQIGVNF